MSRRRIVVTGLGIISPVGIGLTASWSNILAGHSGLARITRFDTSHFPVNIAGEVKDFDVGAYLSAKEARRYDTFVHYGLVSTMEAIKDAGLDGYPGDKERVGVCVGSGIGGLPMIEDNIREMIAKGPRRLSPFFVPGTIINMVAGMISIQFKAKGPNVSMVSACTTSSHSIGEAGRMIEYGDADVMIAGGAEACVNLSGVGGFCACKALSERNDDPATASRPFDKDRDGFVLGEGAGIVILEEFEHAKKRGARIYAELAGMGMSADANHITAPNMDGPRRAMLAALKNAGMNPSDVQYVNAHGTSTPLGDANETAALKAAFGDHAYKLAVNSTKSMLGHLLGAAGAVETIATVLSVRDGVVPVTRNLDDLDDGVQLDVVSVEPRRRPVPVAVNNAFGFGGHNVALVVRKV
jgi:3-oxoacyl-[acyl-carrier-protein] synthase II